MNFRNESTDTTTSTSTQSTDTTTSKTTQSTYTATSTSSDSSSSSSSSESDDENGDSLSDYLSQQINKLALDDDCDKDDLYKEFTSQRGARKLCSLGFSYNIDKINTQSVNWRCDQRK